jgi:hypothetical protein
MAARTLRLLGTVIEKWFSARRAAATTVPV